MAKRRNYRNRKTNTRLNKWDAERIRKFKNKK